MAVWSTALRFRMRWPLGRPPCPCCRRAGRVRSIGSRPPRSVWPFTGLLSLFSTASPQVSNVFVLITRIRRDYTSSIDVLDARGGFNRSPFRRSSFDLASRPLSNAVGCALGSWSAACEALLDMNGDLRLTSAHRALSDVCRDTTGQIPGEFVVDVGVEISTETHVVEHQHGGETL